MEDWQEKFGKAVFTNELFIGKNDVKEILMKRIIKRKIISLATKSISIAACTTFVILLSYSIFFSDITIKAPFNKDLIVYLPDNSEVRLNKNSAITYRRLMWNFKKELTLNGKAYFSVKKGKKFKVTTSLGSISVLGTKFLVDCSGPDLYVRCDEGKVKIETSEGVSYLTPPKISQKKRLITQEKAKETLPPFIEYNNQPLMIVVKRIEQIYNVEFAPSSLYDKIYFSGMIPTNDLNQAMDIITTSCNLSYREVGKKITITASND